MRWIARSTEAGYEAKWWPEAPDGPPVRFVLPENSLGAWRGAVAELATVWTALRSLRLDDFTRCEFLTELAPADLQAETDPASPGDAPAQQAVLERVMFCKFLLALMREGLIAYEGPGRVTEIVGGHLAPFTQGWPYGWLVWREAGIVVALSSGQIRLDPLSGEVGTAQWEYVLEEVCQGPGWEKVLADFLAHQDMLAEMVRWQAQCSSSPEQPVVGNHLNLLKAIVHLLETRSRAEAHPSSEMVRLTQRDRPWLCGRLAAHPCLPSDERSLYLEEIFKQRLPDAEERPLLQEAIVPSLVENAKQNDKTEETADALISRIAQHYLDQYRLDDAVSVWAQTPKAKQDRLLWSLLKVYGRPKFFVVPFLVVWLVTLIAVEFEIWPVATLMAGLLLVVCLGAMAYTVLTVGIRLARRQGFPYLELFLPRLLGSIVVGLTVLALEDTVWRTTLGMPWLNWLLAVGASLAGALAYFFLDVHKRTRLQPAPVGAQKERGSSRAGPTARSVQTTFRLFAIGVLEATGLTTVISALLPLADVVKPASPLLRLPGLAVAQAKGLFTFQLFGSRGLVLSFSPRLILLWAGLALLIGAFAQLLWQDRQITAS